MEYFRAFFGNDYYVCSYDPFERNREYKCQGPFNSATEAENFSKTMKKPCPLISTAAILPKVLQEHIISHKFRPKVTIDRGSDNYPYNWSWM
jgi:hypothetical protein